MSTTVDEPRLRFASDANLDMIAMWKALQRGWNPPTRCSQRIWDAAKKSRGPSAERGFIGAFCSFGGQFFSGYAGKYDADTNYARQAAKSLDKFRDKVQDVEYWGGSFFDLPYEPRGMIIYLDPPYMASKKAKPNKLFAVFDTDKFWKRAQELAKRNLVFVSEESAPKGWKVVWSKDYRRGAANQHKFTKKYTDKGEKAPTKMSVEKLFMWHKLPPKEYFTTRSPKYPF